MRRVALLTRMGDYVGQRLAEALACSEHDLVLQGASSDQVERLVGLGAKVELVTDEEITPVGGVILGDEESCCKLVDRALSRFGRLDAAAVFPRSGVGFTKALLAHESLQNLQGMYGYLESTFHLLRALTPPMVAQRAGQIVIFTSAAGARPAPEWSIYGAVRAGQSFLVRAAALEYARYGICINAVGSKNVVSPGFPLAPTGAATDERANEADWSQPLRAETPLGRLGTVDELAAFCSILLDGRSRFQTGQFFAYAGGWDVA